MPPPTPPLPSLAHKSIPVGREGLVNLKEYSLENKKITDIERDLIEYNFRKYNGDIDKIVLAVGISRTKLYERLKRYGVK